MARLNPKRGDIWVTDLTGGKGWETGKKRPALVISSNYLNSISPMVIVVPISSRIPKTLGFEKVAISNGSSNLDKKSVISTNQIKSIDKTRLVKKIGSLSNDALAEVEDAIKLVLGLEPID